jgi:repressor LexA
VLKYPAAIEAEDFQALPILGAIAAGLPLLAVENIEGELAVPKSMLGGADRAFLLRVKGDSMVGAHIMHGDLVVVKPQETAQSGDLVAVLLGDEATVKQFRAEAGGAVLMPANPAYEPIPIRDRDVRLIGKVIGLLRAY